MEKIVSLCKRRGFIYPSSEIYGGINGFWDYGPLGAELKRNVKELWWNAMTRQRDDVAGLEATIIMSPQIWKASGHVDTFSDPMIDCKTCKGRFRADQTSRNSLPAKAQQNGFRMSRGENRAAGIQPDVPDPCRPGAGRLGHRLSSTGNRAGHFCAVQKRPRNVAPEGAVRHRPGRQGLPQRGDAAQLHLPLARVRADGTGIFHQAG